MRVAMLLLALYVPAATAANVAVHVKSPQAPPGWALLERELLKTSAAACREFYARYFDERGYLLCVERWGGDDGPDDAIENCTNWPILHALGAHDDVLRLTRKAWEGHLRQYTEARTTKVPFARDGMYYKEFPVMFDWLHHAEGLTPFCHLGLCTPNDALHRQRARRFAALYLNENPEAPNYDPKHRIIRSLFNGSRGPLLRKATALDWAGDPIEVGHRFQPRHGERTYEEMLAHFKDYTDIVGDHPENLCATSMPLVAHLLTGDEKYRKWILEYVDAWRERILQNDGIIPTNVGLDGKIGGGAGGKWYGGAYGWGFTVTVPQTGKLEHRNTHWLGLIGFGNAYLLTGDDRYLDPWRKMIDKINAHAKVVDGKPQYPHMYGDQGWYNFTPEKYKHGAEELWYWSMADVDRARLPENGWRAFLAGKERDYPETALRADLSVIRNRVAAMRGDPTTPDTRLSDDPLQYNPAITDALTRLMLGGLPTGIRSLALFSRLRYFDPVKRRAGVPDDVAALVDELGAERTGVQLVNVNQLEPRTVIVQGGAYGEHQIVSVTQNGQTRAVAGPCFAVRLDPGCGTRLVLAVKRYANRPTFAHPWDRGWWPLP